MRRAKIVATLGPATSSYENIRAIIEAGVNVARMNLSHGSYDVHDEVYTNVRNGGLIDGLPGNACVEVPTLIDKNGVQPTRIGALPPQCLALNRTFLNVAELTVRAALEERRSLVYQAALLDPNTAATLTTAQTVAMCDELFAAHRDLLPQAFGG